MGESQLIRVGAKTKVKLENLKIIKEEPMTKVIDRLISIFEIHQKLAEESEIDEELINELMNRINNVKKGEVMSEGEMRKRLFGGK